VVEGMQLDLHLSLLVTDNDGDRVENAKILLTDKKFRQYRTWVPVLEKVASLWPSP